MAVLEAAAVVVAAPEEEVMAEGEGENPTAFILCVEEEGEEASLVGEWELARCRCVVEITPTLDVCEDGSGGLN